MPNAETKSPLVPRRDPAKGKIFSHIRQDWFVEFPEELVRQQFVCTLVNDYGFSLDQMGEELKVQRGRESAEADIVIWRTAKDKADEKTPLIVTECKSDNVAITAKEYGQGESYARIVDAPFFVTHNNRETKFWRVKKDRMPGYIEEITDIPRADATDKEIAELIKKLKVFKEDEFADLLHQCHNVIRNREHLDPAAAFDEIAKVLFMKVCFERRLLRGRDRRNRFTADYLDEKADEFKEPVNVLFAQTKEEYEADYLFANDEEIRLKFPTVREIVRLLERYNLSDTSEDVKGIAFEKFLGRTFRGEIGQFFTPREVVRFMVEMAEPKFGDIICDPASGSGGFLIRFFAKVREQLLAEADAQYAKFKAELEKKKLTEAKRAELLREKWQHLQRDLDPKNTSSRMWELSNRCVYGTDANDRMARTSKMNMIMHGDGHGGVHHWNGFLNVNGIFDGRFNVLLTNPPFGAHVEATALVEVPEGKEWNETKKRYAGEYGQAYRDTVARVEAAKGKPIASLFELPKRGNGDKPSAKLGKIKTELLFIERCLDLLMPGGRLGIVLPEGVFNNPSLGYVREFVEDRAFLRAVISLPPETFFSSGASVKASILFLEKFSDKEQTKFDKLKTVARTEIEAKYADEIVRETKRLTDAIKALAPVAADVRRLKSNSGGDGKSQSLVTSAATKENVKVLRKELADYKRAMAGKMAAESRALLKQRFNYSVFLYEAEHVGITATGEPDVNELYPNERQPTNGGGDTPLKTCVELYREFRKAPESFFVPGPAE